MLSMLSAYLNRSLTPFEWLLYQIFPTQLLGGDIYRLAMEYCFKNDAQAMMWFLYWDDAEEQTFKEPWSVFVDEAQELLEKNVGNFLSKDGTEARSAFSAVIGGFVSCCKVAKELHYPMFSATRLPPDPFTDQTSSVVAKNLVDHYDLCFSGFQPVLGKKR